MIGQIELQKQIQQLVDNNTFPRFSIFVGPRGSGKKTFVHEVIKSLTDGLYVECGIKVDDVRNLIVDAYKVHSTAVFFIPDADKMSTIAMNALLKVTEEPPNNAFIIMTLEDENNTLDTIRSRATTFHMNRYTPNEIVEYAKSKYISMQLNWTDIIKALCETPGDVDLLVGMGTKDFYDYVKLVAENIAEVSLANAFKIANKLALKDDSTGYDLTMFWKAYIAVCVDVARFADVHITSKYLQKLRVSGANKQMLFDNWVMEVRDAWS